MYQNCGWNDWVYVNWEAQGDIPCRIILFFEITHWNERAVTESNDTYIYGPGKYSLCYMIPEKLDDTDNPDNNGFCAHPSSLLVKCAQLMVERDSDTDRIMPAFGIVDIQSFSKPCISVPYNLTMEDNEHYHYLFVEPRSIWLELLIKFCKDEVQI